MLKLNLCVCDLNDGGEILLENYEEMDNSFVEIFDSSLKNGDVSKCDLDGGLSKLDSYFNEYGERSEDDKIKWNKLKKEYKNKVMDKNGKLYLWGVEYDLELMFIES